MEDPRFALVAGVVGGVGLFLLGMHLMTEGLRHAAGGTLRSILARWTGTPLRGIASGALLTGLVQSSSAVTVAAIGFVNAGLLTLAQAIAVIYGSNVGTTVTGWLVALVGIQLDLKALALPMIGVGMAVRLFGRGRPIGSLGEALAGFGIFFLGIDVLKAVFAGLGEGVALDAVAGAGPLRVLAFVGIGFLLTLLFQSSSAAIALVLTAAAGGAVPLGTGAALVVGANVGTTSTAALAVIGATSNARRVAAAHVAFNVITGVVALALLPILLQLILRARSALALDAAPAAVLAAFHTVFNLLGVAVLLPLTGRLVRFLEGRFRTPEEEEGRARFLDRNVATTPVLAIDALVMELTRVGQIARRMAEEALAGTARAGRLASERGTVERLVEAIGDFVSRVQQRPLSEAQKPALPTSLRVARYYSEAAELAESLGATRPDPRLLPPGAVRRRVEDLLADARAFAARAGLEQQGYEPETCAKALAELEDAYQDAKARLLEAGAAGELAVGGLVELLDWLSNVRRLVQQVERGTRFLAGLSQGADDAEPGVVA